MNVERLSVMCELLSLMKAEEFQADSWVTIPTGVELPDGMISILPAGSRTCPVGALPVYNPEAWCWRVVDGDVYPIYKGSQLWDNPPRVLVDGDASVWISRYVWRQLGEWLDVGNVWMLQFILCPSYFSEGDKNNPRAYETRARRCIDLAKSRPDWETECPDHPGDVIPFMQLHGF